MLRSGIIAKKVGMTRLFMEDGKQMQIAYLKAYDAEVKEIAHYHELATEQQFGGWEFKEERFADFQRRWAVAPDGRVAAFLSFIDYRIHVWNADGSVDYLWSVWQDGRRIQMGGRCASAEAAEGEARAFCVNSLGREPQEVRRL